MIGHVFRELLEIMWKIMFLKLIRFLFSKRDMKTGSQIFSKKNLAFDF